MLRKILAVDDSALIHQMYKLFLSRYKNCKLISAMNGLEALDKLGQEDGIDLILLDINMPVMNGLEFLQRVQKEPAYQAIPVIIISTEGKEEDTDPRPQDGRQGLRQEAVPGLRAPRPHREDHRDRELGRPGCPPSRRPPDLLNIYIEDAREPPGDARPRAAVAGARRASTPSRWRAVLGPLHTLKGNSGMIGFSRVKDYVHRLEDVFARDRRRGARRSSASLFDALFAGASALRDAVERACRERGEVRDLAAREGGARRRCSRPRRRTTRAQPAPRRRARAAPRGAAPPRARRRPRPSSTPTSPRAPARCASTSRSSTTC